MGDVLFVWTAAYQTCLMRACVPLLLSGLYQFFDLCLIKPGLNLIKHFLTSTLACLVTKNVWWCLVAKHFPFVQALKWTVGKWWLPLICLIRHFWFSMLISLLNHCLTSCNDWGNKARKFKNTLNKLKLILKLRRPLTHHRDQRHLRPVKNIWLSKTRLRYAWFTFEYTARNRNCSILGFKISLANSKSVYSRG